MGESLMVRRNALKKVYETLIVLYYCLFSFLNSIAMVEGKILLVLTIALNIYFLVKFSKSQPIFICLCFLITYWLYMIMYYYFGINYCTYSMYRNLVYTDGTLRIAGLFMAVLFYMLKPIKQDLSSFLPKRNNSLIFYLCIAVMTVITIYTFSVGGVFTYKEEGNNSSLYEYYFVFAIFAFVFIRTKGKQNLFLIINCIYVLALLKLGLRLVVLQIALMLFILYFSNKFKTRTLLLGVIGAFLFLSAFSLVRSGIQLNSAKFTTILGVKGNDLITNQGDVFYTSSSQYAQVYLGNWDWGFRLESMLSFVANIVLLPANQLVNGKLNSVLELQSIPVPGGGFGAMSAYVWLDIVGVIALALYIAYSINSIETSKSDFRKIYGVFLIFTFFRWNAYNVAVIFKMGFWLLIAYCVISLFSKITHGKRINKAHE